MHLIGQWRKQKNMSWLFNFGLKKTASLVLLIINYLIWPRPLFGWGPSQLEIMTYVIDTQQNIRIRRVWEKNKAFPSQCYKIHAILQKGAALWLKHDFRSAVWGINSTRYNATRESIIKIPWWRKWARKKTPQTCSMQTQRALHVSKGSGEDGQTSGLTQSSNAAMRLVVAIKKNCAHMLYTCSRHPPHTHLPAPLSFSHPLVSIAPFGTLTAPDGQVGWQW